MSTRRRFSFSLVAPAVLLACGRLHGAETTTADHRGLLEALRQGGHNIYFRHAATDWSHSDRLESAGDWTSCDPQRMRQLSQAGRDTARAIGAAIRAATIPVGEILASPYCRTRETAVLLGLGEVRTTTDVMNLRAAAFFGGRAALASRARRLLAAPPPAGTNTVLVAHGNVVREATGEYPGEAGAIVFRPGPGETLGVTARLGPEDWRLIAAGD